jgi:hypothetical protein
MFCPQNKIALQMSLQDQLLSVIAIAHQLALE